MPKATTRKRTATRRSGSEPAVRRAGRLAGEMAIVIREPARSGRGKGGPAVEVARVLGDGARGAVELALSSGRSVEMPREQWEEVNGELKALVREELTSLDADAREAVLETLAGSTAIATEPSFELSTSLYGLREVLRERLPRCAVKAEQPAGLAVEQILAIDDGSYWINGWMHDEDGLGEVIVVSPEGARVCVTDEAYRYERPDVVEFYSGLGVDRTRLHGLTTHFTLPAPSLLSGGWIAELHTSDGLHLEIECPAVVRDPQVARAKILGELSAHGRIGGRLAASHGREALTRLQARIVAESEVDSIDSYGAAPASPEVSVVVPLYKRLDFIEHQLLQFSRDPEFAEAELIYVLDSTEQAEELKKQASELFALYGLPFRVVNLTASAGFAGANGHGIEAARGKRLLLLNSDVIPDRPGWLGAMTAFYEEKEGIGALAPKLLYEDDSLQHAGLYFHRESGSELWENAHCFKGLHRSFPAANVARPVPAVTAACMLIDRDLYEKVGGLPLHYVQGDYEDSELCLKLVEAGHENWYLPEVELYHLEGQSYVPGARRLPSEYNMWLHTELWGKRIEELMKDFDPFSGVQRDDA
ncbi:MAG: glycosyltransferase family 2 protein [Solirubrobacterales bacterium]